jgi:hypothetical protein
MAPEVKTAILLAILLLPLLVGLFFAKRFWHKRVTRALSIIVLLPATLAYVWFAYVLVRLDSFPCLGPCG